MGLTIQGAAQMESKEPSSAVTRMTEEVRLGDEMGIDLNIVLELEGIKNPCKVMTGRPFRAGEEPGGFRAGLSC